MKKTIIKNGKSNLEKIANKQEKKEGLYPKETKLENEYFNYKNLGNHFAKNIEQMKKKSDASLIYVLDNYDELIKQAPNDFEKRVIEYEYQVALYKRKNNML